MAETYYDLLKKATSLGVQAPTTQQIQQASTLVTSPGNLAQPTSGLGSTQRTNELLQGASQITSIPATMFTQAPQQPVQLPQKPADTTSYSSILGNSSAISSSSQSFTLPDYLQKYLDSSTPPSSGLADYNKLYDQAGIAGKESALLANEQAVKSAQSELDVINAQLQGIQGTLTSDQLKLKGEGISSEAIASRGTNLEREAAIRAIPLQTQGLMAQAKIASAQGDLEGSQRALDMANDKVNTIFKIYSDDKDRQYKYQQDLRNVVFDYATKAEQRMLDAQKQQDDRDFQIARDQINYAQSLAKTAIENGQSALASQIMQEDPNDPSYMINIGNLASQIKPKPTKSSTTASTPVIPFDQFVTEYMTTPKGIALIQQIESQRNMSMTQEAKRKAVAESIQGLYDQTIEDSRPEGSKFTPTELKKLEQAGLLYADKQKQLDHLYGKKDTSSKVSDDDFLKQLSDILNANQ